MNWINSWKQGNKKEKYNIELRLGKFTILEGANTIQLCSHGVGKYGRCLGELHVDMVDGKECLTLANVNELLIKEGHAVEYHGGKR